MKTINKLMYVFGAALVLFLFPLAAFSQDSDGDGVPDRNDNCVSTPNSAQSDFEWNSQPGVLVLFDDSLAIHSWYNPPGLTGSPVKDGAAALVITGNQYIQEIAPDLGQSGPQRYLRFWIYLTSGTADLALQMNCGDGQGWDHKWGFSGDGAWSGEAWSFQGIDYNLPVGQWVPIMFDIQGPLSCDNGSPIYGLGWSTIGGAVAYVDSAAFYPASPYPYGDACEDSDGDGLDDGDEVTIFFTDPLDPDTDNDGFSDFREVADFQTDPVTFDPDSDFDGLPDAVESGSGFYAGLFDTGTYFLQFDTDNDGVGDGMEIEFGSHPLNNQITPRAATHSDFKRRLTYAANHSYAPLLAWNGTDEFGLSWDDSRDGNREMYFARLSPYTIATIGPEIRLTYNGPNSNSQWMVWNGSEYALVWNDNVTTQIQFTRVSAGGAQIGGNIILVSSPSYSQVPSLAWTGTEYGVSWFDSRDGNWANGDWEIYFTRASADGVEIGSDTRITNAVQMSFYPALAWNGSEYGLCWNDRRDDLVNEQVYFARLGANGGRIGPDVRVTFGGGTSTNVYPLWTGSAFALVWQDTRDGNSEIYFAKLDANGQAIGPNIRVTENPGTSMVPSRAPLAFTGREYGLTWQDNRDGNDEIYFAVLAPDGVKVGPELRITEDPASSMTPAIAWTGSSFAIVWHDDRDGNHEIYYAAVALDSDGDGCFVYDEINLGTDPYNWDTDGDWVSDFDEGSMLGTDPLDPDTDGDGVTDGIEAWNLLSDPLDPDSDGDGLTDGEEFLVFGTDVLDRDTDGDNLSDGWEVNSLHTNPWEVDTDGDGLSDSVEGSLYTNPLYYDTNQNGIPDGLEAQGRYLDVDGDGMPTEWESMIPCLSAHHGDSLGDQDSDGLTNLEEYNLGTNPCFNDSDYDGISDSNEVNLTLTNPLLRDTDGDWLDDPQEINQSLTDPLLSDTDGDGWCDGVEYLDEGDPLNPLVFPPWNNHLVNYQGRLMTAAGQPVSGPVSMTFRLFDVLSGGTAFWEETQNVSVQGGIYNVLLGSVTPLSPDTFAELDSPGVYLEVAANGETMTPRARIASVPTAIFAEQFFEGRLESDEFSINLNVPAASVTVHVAFEKAFYEEPKVMVSPPDNPISNEYFIPVRVFNITGQGFDVTFASLSGRPATGHAIFTYQAFGN